ncbi:Uncharacterised protein [BD1-7 clade bacterium]|uniref:Outer membrane protein beta-barrel domain-containing protein n=1 Tax=BD1-7 clade bacterium TaxID=2029982 RepID=A0A5S9PMW8_9GAMM|nr:Uncharacterised protein [BD1-7 clade bacterium]
MKKFITTALLSASLVSSYTYADSDEAYDRTGWYVGGNLGFMNIDLNPDKAGSRSLEGSSISVGPYGGYNVNEWFGIEFAGQVGPLAGDTDGFEDGSALTLTVAPKFTYQASDLVGLFVKTGIAVLNYSASPKGVISSNGVLEDESVAWNGVGYTVGAGIQFSVAKDVYVRATYDYSSANLSSNDKIISDGDIYKLVDLDATYSEFKVGAHYQF